MGDDIKTRLYIEETREFNLMPTLRGRSERRYYISPPLEKQHPCIIDWLGAKNEAHTLERLDESI